MKIGFNRKRNKQRRQRRIAMSVGGGLAGAAALGLGYKNRAAIGGALAEGRSRVYSVLGRKRNAVPTISPPKTAYTARASNTYRIASNRDVVAPQKNTSSNSNLQNSMTQVKKLPAGGGSPQRVQNGKPNNKSGNTKKLVFGHR